MVMLMQTQTVRYEKYVAIMSNVSDCICIPSSHMLKDIRFNTSYMHSNTRSVTVSTLYTVTLGCQSKMYSLHAHMHTAHRTQYCTQLTG